MSETFIPRSQQFPTPDHTWRPVEGAALEVTVWSRGPVTRWGAVRQQYVVTVQDVGTGDTYEAMAYGPAREVWDGRHDYRGMARLVLADLTWWGSDPDGFLEVMLDGGMTPARFREVRDTVDAFERVPGLVELVEGYQPADGWLDGDDA